MAELALQQVWESSLGQTIRGLCLFKFHDITKRKPLDLQNTRNISERLRGEPQTNQRAELTAILRALQKVSVDQDVQIHTDSKYSLNCITEWYRGWVAKGWKTQGGEDVKNKDLVQAIRAKIDDRDASGTKTLFQWVRGHGISPGNIEADKLAVRGSGFAAVA
jgi:ribonuclease HI